MLTKILIPKITPIPGSLCLKKCSVRRVIYNDEDDDDDDDIDDDIDADYIDADAASENSESLPLHDNH